MKKYLALFFVFVFAFTGCGQEETAEKTSEKISEKAETAETVSSSFSTENVPLERNNVPLYLSCQYGEKTSGKNILLVHGLTYSSHQFDNEYGDYSLSRYLAGQGYKVWLLDIAGYGRSGKVKDGFAVDSDYAAEDIAAAAKAITAKENVPKIDVLGWSWGTVTTSRFARDNPELIDKLILYAPIVTGLGADKVEEPYHANTWENAAGDFQKTESGEFDHSIVEPAVVTAYLSACWRYDGGGSPNGPRRDLLTDDLLIDAGSIPVRTLVIYGDKDDYLNREKIDEMKLPEGSEKVMIHGASHVMMLEKPFYKDFRENIVRFLEK